MKPVSQRISTTARPLLPGSNGNRPLIFAALVGIPALAYYIIPSRAAKSLQQGPDPAVAVSRPPNLDPAADKRRRGRRAEEQRRYAHPEHEDPAAFKPAFGLPHRHKRVDGPPDGRHHQALSDRARVQAR
ncbi:hypothetical protein SAMD00023353_0203020 [Rosellinia necatrix]|uniref:Uncharacterized protein n=1 Tax=Rosellinia necatrix TaxID=77044 RepID=A0A1S8A5K9_ROSNE|nr:hypothetical protein SAMD00023353_0203020 [Rosellinia necatrix]